MKILAKPLLYSFGIALAVTFFLIFLNQIDLYQKSQREIKNYLNNPPSQEELKGKGVKNLSEYGIDGKTYHCYRCLDTLGDCDRWENRVCDEKDFTNTYYQKCKSAIFEGCPLSNEAVLWDLIVFTEYIPILPIIFILSSIFFYRRYKRKEKTLESKKNLPSP